jgi:hypothetical protein
VFAQSPRSGSRDFVGGRSQDPPACQREVDHEDELGVECCYTRRNKVWARDPDVAEWEWPTVLGDSEVMVDGTNCC